MDHFGKINITGLVETALGVNNVYLYVGKVARTLLCSTGDINNVGDIGRELGKEGDGGGLSDPAADVAHQLRVLEWWGGVRSRLITGLCRSQKQALPFKGTVYTTMKILSFIYPHVFPKPYTSKTILYSRMFKSI